MILYQHMYIQCNSSVQNVYMYVYIMLCCVYTHVAYSRVAYVLYVDIHVHVHHWTPKITWTLVHISQRIIKSWDVIPHSGNNEMNFPLALQRREEVNLWFVVYKL